MRLGFAKIRKQRPYRSCNCGAFAGLSCSALSAHYRRPAVPLGLRGRSTSAATPPPRRSREGCQLRTARSAPPGSSSSSLGAQPTTGSTLSTCRVTVAVPRGVLPEQDVRRDEVDIGIMSAAERSGARKSSVAVQLLGVERPESSPATRGKLLSDAPGRAGSAAAAGAPSLANGCCGRSRSRLAHRGET